MSFIDEVRRDREDLAKVVKRHKGIRKIVEDLYPDSAHFIYELLQNAEDAGATEAEFILSESALAFLHDGRPFETHDVYAITDIGEGTKAGDEDKIGRFGVGFKAVFAYSETPQIWSPTFSFQITDLVLPSDLEPMPDLNGQTRFVFPFNSSKKSCRTAYTEVKAALGKFSETTLLFLSHLKSIRWRVESTSREIRRVQHSDHHFEVVKSTSGRTVASYHLLKFEQPVKHLPLQRVAIAFALGFQSKHARFISHKSLGQQVRVLPATPGRVAVYFPAGKEVSGLRFHLHAPFVPELSRASIKETPANAPLFELLASLTAASLHKIRDLGLLTRDFLGVLPNPSDELGTRYECIRSAIVEEMQLQPLTPTHAGTHVAAEHLRQARPLLKGLLSDEDIEFLIDYDDEPPRWAISTTNESSEADCFLDGLEIDKWDVDGFVEELERRSAPHAERETNETFVAWMSKKSLKWHQSLYAFLGQELDSNELDRLGQCQILRLVSGDYCAGSDCFFSDDGANNDDTHPRIDSRVYRSGRNKREQVAAKRFLQRIGVREVGEVDEVTAILEQRYSEKSKIPNKRTHVRDLTRFARLVENSPETAEIFASYWILECDDAWRTPHGMFLDRPFEDTGLAAYHDALPQDHDARCFALTERYKSSGISIRRLVRFAKAIGVQFELPVERQSTWHHPLRHELRGAFGATRRTSTASDVDWFIPGLEVILSQPTREIAKLLWRTLVRLNPTRLKAIYRPNQQYASQEVPSSLVIVLQNHRWVPQGKGEFVFPADALRGRLPKGFDFDPDWEWLEAIQFGDNDARKSEERRRKQNVLKELGFTSKEAYEQAQWFARIPRRDRDRIRANYDRASSKQPEGTDQSGGKVPESGIAGTKNGRNGIGRKTHGARNGESSESNPNDRTRTSSGKAGHRFVSYVAAHPDSKEPDPDGLDHETRMQLEETAIQRILTAEQSLRRTPTNNPGFDLFEAGESGQIIRWVEVKAHRVAALSGLR